MVPNVHPGAEPGTAFYTGAMTVAILAGEAMALAAGLLVAFFASLAVARAEYPIVVWLPVGVVVFALWSLAVSAT